LCTLHKYIILAREFIDFLFQCV